MNNCAVMLQILVVHAEELCCEDHLGHACHDELRPCCATLVCGNKGPGGIGMCAWSYSIMPKFPFDHCLSLYVTIN